MANDQNKTFWSQFLFHIKIKTTYQNVLPATEILELRLKQGSDLLAQAQVLGPEVHTYIRKSIKS